MVLDGVVVEVLDAADEPLGLAVGAGLELAGRRGVLAVGEGRVGRADGAELLGRAAEVGVGLLQALAVGGLEFAVAGAPVDPQDGVRGRHGPR